MAVRWRSPSEAKASTVTSRLGPATRERHVPTGWPVISTRPGSRPAATPPAAPSGRGSASTGPAERGRGRRAAAAGTAGERRVPQLVQVGGQHPPRRRPAAPPPARRRGRGSGPGPVAPMPVQEAKWRGPACTNRAPADPAGADVAAERLAQPDVGGHQHSAGTLRPAVAERAGHAGQAQEGLGDVVDVAHVAPRLELRRHPAATPRSARPWQRGSASHRPVSTPMTAPSASRAVQPGVSIAVHAEPSCSRRDSRRRPGRRDRTHRRRTGAPGGDAAQARDAQQRPARRGGRSRRRRG